MNGYKIDFSEITSTIIAENDKERENIPQNPGHQITNIHNMIDKKENTA